MKPGSGRAFFCARFPSVRVLAFLLLALCALPAGADENDWQVPFITTPGDVVERMLDLAATKADDYVVDLGSGDGRIVITAARKYGARGLGIELDADLVRTSRENARRAGVADRVKFVQGDVLTTDFSSATVVTVYLLPDLIGKLQPIFVDALKPGTRIVSHAFGMAGWRPDRTQSITVTQPHPGQGDESTLRLWIVPADVRGTWRVPDGRRVRIEQNYQEIEVEGAKTATLSGAEVAWQSPEGRFHGRVFEGRIEGALTSQKGVQALTLTRER